MLRTELDKLEQKREIYNRGDYMLSIDGLTGEIKNLEFEAVDNNLYRRLVRKQYLSPREQELINQLNAGERERRNFENENTNI